MNLVGMVYSLIDNLKIKYEAHNMFQNVAIFLINRNFKGLILEKEGPYDDNGRMVIARVEYRHNNTNIRNEDVLLTIHL